MRLILQAAMQEEIAPILTLAQPEPLWQRGEATAWSGQLAGHDVTFIRSGIGLVNAAIAASVALENADRSGTLPDLILAVGTCGGLKTDVSVADQIIGDSYVYNGADATIFGYALGQIPRMPATYSGSEIVINTAHEAELATTDDTQLLGGQGRIIIGQVLSGDSFIEHRSIERIRKLFPHAVATDMESCAIAQTAAAWDIPFASVRTVSDCCDWTPEQAAKQDSDFITLVTQRTDGTAAPTNRRELVFEVAARQLLEFLQLIRN